MNPKIPVIGTLQEALRMVAAHRRDLLRVGLVFIIGFLALLVLFWSYMWPAFSAAMMGGTETGSPPPVDPRLPLAFLIMYVLYVLLLAVFAVGWHRAVLIGPERGQGAQLGGRELRYFGRLWLCVIIGVVALFFVATVEQFIGLALHADPQSMTWGAVFSCQLVIAYVFARLGASFAALSIDRPMTFRESWIVTKGSGFRILLIYVLAGLGGMVLDIFISLILNLLGLGEIAPYTVVLVAALTFCVLFALAVSINAIVFARLTGWKVPT